MPARQRPDGRCNAVARGREDLGTKTLPSALILIVDDNAANLRLATDALEREGYVVERASDAGKAQDILERTVPDLILMDLALSGTDGALLVRKLRAESRLKHVPIIALTAYEMRGEGEKARKMACDGYITKPLDTRKLPVQVAAFLVRGPAPGAPPRA